MEMNNYLLEQWTKSRACCIHSFLFCPCFNQLGHHTLNYKYIHEYTIYRSCSLPIDFLSVPLLQSSVPPPPPPPPPPPESSLHPHLLRRQRYLGRRSSQPTSTCIREKGHFVSGGRPPEWTPPRWMPMSPYISLPGGTPQPSPGSRVGFPSDSRLFLLDIFFSGSASAESAFAISYPPARVAFGSGTRLLWGKIAFIYVFFCYRWSIEVERIEVTVVEVIVVVNSYHCSNVVLRGLEVC